MMAAQLRIMIRAAQIRLAQGEKIEAVLASWPALDDANRERIRAAVALGVGGDGR